jgi:hypothetical protein
MSTNGANGKSIYDLITNGWKRTVCEFGSSNTKYVSIPGEVAEANDIEKGDDIALREPDDDSCDLQIHFNSDE